MGSWERTTPNGLEEASKRGNGNCFWYGCEFPGHIAATWSPALLNKPDYQFCSLHAKEAAARAERSAEPVNLARGAWEQAPVKRPAVAAQMRSRAMQAKQELVERDGHRQAILKKI